MSNDVGRSQSLLAVPLFFFETVWQHYEIVLLPALLADSLLEPLPNPHPIFIIETVMKSDIKWADIFKNMTPKKNCWL